MCKVLRITVATATVGIVALSLTVGRRYFRKRTRTANGVCRSATAAGLLCAATAAGLLRDRGLWTSVRLSQVPSPLIRVVLLRPRCGSRLPSKAHT